MQTRQQVFWNFNNEKQKKDTSSKFNEQQWNWLVELTSPIFFPFSGTIEKQLKTEKA